jgi:hypothetical protein
VPVSSRKKCLGGIKPREKSEKISGLWHGKIVGVVEHGFTKEIHKMKNIFASTGLKVFGFFIIAIAFNHSHAGIIKCTEADGRVFYLTTEDAISMTQKAGVSCHGLGSKVEESKKAKKSYQEFFRTKSKIKGINSVKLSDLHHHIRESLPSDSKSAIDEWARNFPPFNEGISIQYPTVLENAAEGKVVEVSESPCSGINGGILFETEEYNDKYIGKNAFGATAEVREETTIQYCLVDISAYRARFLLPESKKINKKNLVIIGKGRLDIDIKSDYSSHKPTFNAPLDSTRAIHQFKIHAEEYLLVDKKTGEILDRKPAYP